MATTRAVSRTRAKKKPPSKEIAVVEKSQLELAFETITKEMHESFDRTTAEMMEEFDNTVETLPSNETWLIHIDKVFDMVEQSTHDMVTRLENESGNGDAILQTEVDFVKGLSEIEEMTKLLWESTYEAHAWAAHAQGLVTTVGVATNIPR